MATQPNANQMFSELTQKLAASGVDQLPATDAAQPGAGPAPQPNPTILEHQPPAPPPQQAPQQFAAQPPVPSQPPQQPQQPPQPEPSRVFLDELGQDPAWANQIGNFQNDRQLMQGLLNAVDYYAGMARQSQQQPPQQPAPAQEPTPPPEPPSDPLEAFLASFEQPPAAYSPEFERFVTINPTTGLAEPNDQYVPQQYVQAVNDQLQWQKQQQRRITDPQFMSQLVEAVTASISAKQPSNDEMREQLRAEIAAEQQMTQQEAEFQNFLRENQANLYQSDASGAPLVDRLTGQPVLTEQGVEFWNAYQNGMATAEQYNVENKDAFAAQQAISIWNPPETPSEAPVEPQEQPEAPVNESPRQTNGTPHEPVNRITEAIQQEHQSGPPADFVSNANRQENPNQPVNLEQQLRLAAKDANLPAEVHVRR